MDENLNTETTEESIQQDQVNTSENSQSTYKKLIQWSQKPQSRLLLSACAIFGFIFTCFIFIFQILLTPIAVVGASMQPTINVNATGSDYSRKTDIVYYAPASSYDYKDIVIVDGAYAHGAEKIIKRVIAKPGQTIKFEVADRSYDNAFTGSSVKVYLHTNVYVDGFELVENYIKEVMKIKVYKQYNTSNYKEYYSFYDTFTETLDSTGVYEYTLNSDEYFIMGDNRNNSTDSRYFGAVKTKDIQGKVVLQVPYGESLFSALWQTIFG